MQYKQWLTEWLINYIQPTTKLRTFERYSEIVNQHIVPNLGNYELNVITPIMLQNHITNLLKTGNLKNHKGLSANSVNAIINVIQSSLKTAYYVGYTSTYIADKIKRPKVQEKQVTSFTQQEQKKIEQAVLSSKKDKMFGVLLCLYSGLRIGELLALEWDDVDLQKGIMTISKSCHDGKDESGKYTRIIDTPKTHSSRRVVPLPRQIEPLIRKYKKKSHSTFVVSSGDKPISVRSYQRTFELLLKRLKIEHKGFHSLRHTFATRALECGMDVKTLSEILGHKSPTITLNRYVHSLIDHKKDMMNKLGKLLRN